MAHLKPAILGFIARFRTHLNIYHFTLQKIGNAYQEKEQLKK
jgi:hypothetical protein